MIPNRFYVYLAIKLSYSGSNPSIDIPSFCEQWELSEVQLATAIAQLHKKGNGNQWHGNCNWSCFESLIEDQQFI